MIGRRRFLWLTAAACMAPACAPFGPLGSSQGGAAAPASAPTPSKALQAADAMPPRAMRPLTTIAAAGGEPFKQPYAIALDTDENVYVVDNGGKRVCKFNKDGEFVTAWGNAGAGDGVFESPMDLAFGPGGNLFVLDRGTGFVSAFNRDGQFQWKFTGSGFYNPIGLAADAQTIVVADTGKKRVLAFDAQGKLVKEIARPEISELQEPVDVLADPDGSIVAVDGGLGQILRFSADGKLARGFDALAQGPSRIARFADGSFLVSGPNRGRLHRWGADGGLVAVYGGVTAPEESRLVLPTGLAVDPAGDVYVVETQAHRVRKFRLE